MIAAIQGDTRSLDIAKDRATSEILGTSHILPFGESASCKDGISTSNP